jgi:hypothetical protein
MYYYSYYTLIVRLPYHSPRPPINPQTGKRLSLKEASSAGKLRSRGAPSSQVIYRRAIQAKRIPCREKGSSRIYSPALWQSLFISSRLGSWLSLFFTAKKEEPKSLLTKE